MTDFAGLNYKLTNEEVKTALLVFDSSDHALFGEGSRAALVAASPFGFDLERVNPLVQAILAIFAANVAPDRDDTLNTFRRDLIFVTAAAARGDVANLVGWLYCALMECQQQNADDPDYQDPEAPSAAGQYLLRCLSVQAAYNNFTNYVLIIERFACVVAAIKAACANTSVRAIGAFLSAAQTRPDDPASASFPDLPSALPEVRAIRFAANEPARDDDPRVGRARDFGGRLAPQLKGKIVWVLDKWNPDPETQPPTLSDRFLESLTQVSSVAIGAPNSPRPTLVRFRSSGAATPWWTSAPGTLTLFVPWSPQDAVAAWTEQMGGASLVTTIDFGNDAATFMDHITAPPSGSAFDLFSDWINRLDKDLQPVFQAARAALTVCR